MTHRTVVDLSGVDNGKYNMVLIGPVPGMAYGLAQPLTTDTAVQYGAVNFPDYDALFGSGAQTTGSSLANVSKFRIISQTVRAQATSATLNNSGRITAVRLDETELLDNVISGVTNPVVSGLWPVTAAEMASYPGAVTAHVNDGLSCWTVNSDETWKWFPIFNSGAKVLPAEDVTKTLLTPAGTGATLKSISGWGGTVPMVICISGSNVNTTVSLEITQTVEYVPVPGSLLASLASPSPAHDPLALELYKTAAREMPVAVPRIRNDGFWEKFLQVIEVGAAPIGALFGPIGRAVGATLSTVSSGLRSMTLGGGRGR